MIPVSLDPSHVSAIGTTNTRKPQNGFQQLMQSLQAGDLSAAQQAYATLASQRPSDSRASTSNLSNPSVSTLSNDLTAVGKALQSGDLDGARQAFARLQQDAQAAGSARGHHRHSHIMPPAPVPSNQAVSNPLLRTKGVDTVA